MLEKTTSPHKKIIKRIEQQGFVSVAEYMEIASNAYYNNKMPFGSEGDFTTAPEVSQMFGEMLGAWFVDLWQQMEKPHEVKFVELGPGRGTLSADIMRTISSLAPDFKNEISLHLVENSSSLRQIQKEVLKDYKVEWHNSFDEVPQGCCFFVANEFFDALPIHQFKKLGGEWQEQVVVLEDDSFKFELKACDDVLIPRQFKDAEEGSFCEVSPLSLKIINQIAERIDQYGGAGLIIDYGHISSGLGDTLQAVAKHNYSDVLTDPGGKDITAHVDFEALKNAVEGKAAFIGPITQGEFLQSLGIELRAQNIREKADSRQEELIMTALNRLIAEDEMGELFKVCALLPKESIIEAAES